MSGSEWGPHEEVEEYPDECEEERQEKELLIEELMEKIGDREWVEELVNIENDPLRQHNIERAEQLVAKRRHLEGKLEAGEISKSKFSGAADYDLRRATARAKTSAALAAVGISHDHLGDVSTKYQHLIGAAASGDTRVMDLMDKVEETIDRIGPDSAIALADKMREQEELSPEAYEAIVQKANLKKYSNDD